MIVQKAVQMAQKMDIPVLGMVENMRFLKCPDCGREIPLFGSDDAVDSTNVPGLEACSAGSQCGKGMRCRRTGTGWMCITEEDGTDSDGFFRRKRKQVRRTYRFFD